MKEAFKRVVPSLAFVHIPVHATWSFQQKKAGGANPNTEPGIDEEIIGYQGDECDIAGDNCEYTGRDSPFMKALVETEGLMAVFSGHDHGIDWCVSPLSTNHQVPFVCLDVHPLFEHIPFLHAIRHAGCDTSSLHELGSQPRLGA